MSFKLCTHPILTKVLNFIFVFAFINVTSSTEVRDAATGSILINALFAMALVLLLDFTNHDKHTIYSKLDQEAAILKEIEKLGFRLLKNRGSRTIFFKPKSWGLKRINIEKNEHLLKIELPQKYVQHFEKYVR